MLNRVITNIYVDALRLLDLKVSPMNILVAAAKMGTARTNEGSRLAGSDTRQGWPLAAVSPDIAGAQAPEKDRSEDHPIVKREFER